MERCKRADETSSTPCKLYNNGIGIKALSDEYRRLACETGGGYIPQADGKPPIICPYLDVVTHPFLQPGFFDWD
jgi:hypothetical protein